MCHTNIHALCILTVPSLTCDKPVSSNGLVTVNWSYNHTGGLPLTSLSVSYTKSINRSIVVSNNNVSVRSVNITSVVIPNLEVGAEYTFNITAGNRNGSSSIMCGPTSHIIGNTRVAIYDKLK